MSKAFTVTHRQLILFFSMVLVCALILSPFLLSVGMIALAVLGVFELSVQEGRPHVRWHYAGWQRLRNLHQHPVFGVLLLIMLVPLLRFWPVDHPDYLLERLRIKVPFVVLPLAFVMLPRFDRRMLTTIFYTLLTCLFVTSLGVLFNYLQNYEVLTEILRRGHHIPTPRNHIRYSLLLAWGIVVGVHVYAEDWRLRYAWEPKIVLGITLYLFFFIHLLSVKSGLLILYICLLWMVLRWTAERRSLAYGLLALAGLVLVPILANYLIPSFANKVDYFLYDIHQFLAGQGADHSDSGRLASYDAGIHVIQEAPFWGVGTSNIKAEITAYFQAHYPTYPQAFMPHNQFMYSWGSYGIIGAIVVYAAFLYPLFHRRNYRHHLFAVFMLSMLVITTIEHALENAVSIGHYLFFLLVFLSYLNRQPATNENR
ncbi:MAG: O-antigen ligase family protein [Bacteroidota bacterium]